MPGIEVPRTKQGYMRHFPEEARRAERAILLAGLKATQARIITTTDYLLGLTTYDELIDVIGSGWQTDIVLAEAIV